MIKLRCTAGRSGFSASLALKPVEIGSLTICADEAGRLDVDAAALPRRSGPLPSMDCRAHRHGGQEAVPNGVSTMARVRLDGLA